LLGGLLLLNNVTKAASGTLNLEITAGTWYCVYATDLDLWQTWFSYSTRNREGTFNTTDASEHRYCVDEEGLASRSVTIQTTDLLNMTTANSAHTVPATDVSVANTQATVTAWDCTAQTVANVLWTNYIDSATTLFGKTSAAWEICKIETASDVDLRVELAASQAIWVYSGTLTISIPSF
jgi:hypothetical protein